MMKTIFRFVLTLTIGMLLGYLLHPTISKKLEGTKVEGAVKVTAGIANEFAQSKLDLTTTE